MIAFVRACIDGDLDIIKDMLQTDSIRRKELLKLTTAYGSNCLHMAVSNGHQECTRYLLTTKELEICTKDRKGYTAFHLACRKLPLYRPSYFHLPILSIKMIKMLFDANNDFVNCCSDDHVSPLQSAVEHHHLDVVKFLIDLGATVNHKDSRGSTVLHTAASATIRRVECVRYLLYETNCDPSVRDQFGWLACCKFVRGLLVNRLPSNEEIQFGVEFLVFTYESPAETIEVYFLLLDCFDRKGRAYNVFIEIVKLLLPHHPRKKFLMKLFAKIPRNYCLITLILFEMIEKSIANCNLIQTERYLRLLEHLKSHFLQELFTLYLANETYFNEYIEMVVTNGWKFNEFEIVSKFCSNLTDETSSQIVFNFIKSLLQHKFSIMTFPQPANVLLLSHMRKHVLYVFAPLSNFVNVPIELVKIFGSKKCDRRYNFNESENCVSDYRRLLLGSYQNKSVVSLKNLSRMSLRKYIFQSCTHYEALSTLYSLDMPLKLRQYLCYNYSNLQF